MRGKRMFLGGVAVMHSFYGKSTYRSSGERIYYLAINGAGRRVSFQGGPPWLSMMGGSCVNCHGVNGLGGIRIMMSDTVAPDITYQALVSGRHDGYRDGNPEAAPTYDDDLIKRAITDGLDAAGRPLDWRLIV